MFRSSPPPGVPPTPDEAFACGSRSTSSVFFSITEREAARLTAVVVFPTPPFWLATVRIRANTGPPFPGNTTVYGILYHGGGGRERGKSRAGSLVLALAAGFQVKFMEEPVDDGGEEEPGHHDEHQPAEERVGGGEQLSRCRAQLCDRPHPPEDHRGVEDRVHPRDPLDPMVPGHSQKQGGENRGGGQSPAPGDSAEIRLPGNQRLMVVFVHFLTPLPRVRSRRSPAPPS